MGIRIRLLAAVLAIVFASLSVAAATSFQFGSVPPRAFVGVPVPITIRALTANNVTDTNFTAEVPLRAQVIEAPTVVFSEINFTNGIIEFVNPGTVPVDISGWELHINQQSSGAPQGLVTHFDFPTQTVVPPQGTILFSPRELTNATAPVFVGKPYPGGNVIPAVRIELRDAAGAVVDQIFTSSTPPNEHEILWRGAVIQRGLSGAWRWHRVGSRNNFATNDWTSGDGIYGETHPGLGLPWTSEVLSLALAPASVPFTNGVWSGDITFPMGATGVMLRVFSDNGATGEAGPIEIEHTPFISGTPDDGPARLFVDAARFGWLREGMGFQVQPTFVFLSKPGSNDVVVTLQADEPLDVPAEVVIPAGQSSARFFVHVGDDNVFQGTNLLWLRAQSTGLETAAIPFAMNDDNEDPVFLAISPGQVPENSPVQAEVRFASPRPYDLTLTISTDAPERLTVPASVVLPAGQTNVWFTLAVPNNDRLDFNSGARVTLITAEGAFEQFQVALVDDEVNVEKLEIGWVAPSQLVGRPIPLTVQLANFHGFVQRTNTSGELRLIDPGEGIPFPPREISFTNGVWAGEVVLQAPGGQVQFEASAAGFTATSTPFNVFAGTNIALISLDAVWEPVTGTFLISEGPSTNATGRLLAINPTNGEVVRSMALPKPAIKIAVSEDGSVAWLASARETLQRVDLTTWAPAVEFVANPANTTQGANDLVLLPGSTNRVVALVGPLGIPTPTEWRLALFENGVRQTNAAAITDSTFNAQLAPGSDGSEVILETYSYLSRYTISGNIISFAQQTNAPISGSDVYNLVTADGKLYHSAGKVIDPSTLATEAQLSEFPFGGGLIAAAPKISRAYFLWNSLFKAVDIPSTRLVTEFSYEHLLKEYPTKDFLYWPNQGFAFVTASNVLFLRTPLAVGNVADLSLSFAGPASVTNSVLNGLASFDWTLMVTNHGPGIASHAVLTFGESSAVQIGELEPGESRAVKIPSGKYGYGIRFESIQIGSAADDPNLDNNSAVASTAVMPPGQPDIMILPLSSLDVSADRNLLYGGLSTTLGASAPGVAVIDPSAREVLRVLPLPADPTRLAVSSDDRFLFVQIGTNQLLRWDFVPGQVDALLTLTNETVLDLAPLPDDPGALSVVTTRRVMILDGNAIRLQQILRSGEIAGIGFASGKLWLAEPGLMTSFSVDLAGLSDNSSASFSLNGSSCDFVSNGRYLYFRSGAFDTQTSQSSSAYFGLYAVYAATDLPWMYSASWRSISRRELWPPTEVASQKVPLPEQVFDLVAWGEGGLAIRASDEQLFILESGLVPTIGSADVGVFILPPTNAFVMDPVEWRLVVTNHSSEDALRLNLSFNVPDWEDLLSSSVEGTNLFQQGFIAYSSIERLPAHSAAEYRIRGIALNGTINISAQLIAGTADPNRANNTADSFVFIDYLRADLSLAEIQTVTETNVGDVFDAVLTVTNSSPTPVGYVSLMIPKDGAFDLLSVNRGELVNADSYFSIFLTNSFPAHSNFTTTARLKLLRGGIVPISISVGGNVIDEVAGNNARSAVVFGSLAESNGWTHLPSTLFLWSQQRDELIVGISNGSGWLLGLDPRTLRPRWRVELPVIPWFIALTSDAQFVWAALADGQAVRVNLQTAEIDETVQLHAEPGYLNGFGVPAGETNAVFAILDPGFSGNPSIFAFRDGARLPQSLPGNGRIFTTPTGRTFVYSSGQLRELELLPAGVAVLANYDHLAPFSGDPVFAEGNRFYYATGETVDLDAGTSDSRWRDTAPIGVNFERSEIYDQVMNNFIRAWDLTSSAPKWSYQIPNRFGAAQFVSLGTNGVLVPGSPAHVIRPHFFEPSADLSISASMTNYVLGTNLPVFVPVVIRNDSHFAPANARLRVTPTAGLQLVDFPNGEVPLGAFYTETNLTLNLLATQPGEHRLSIVVENDVVDRVATNNVWEQILVIAPKPTLLLENLTVREGQQVVFHLSTPAARDLEVEFWIELLTASRADLTTTNGTLSFSAQSRFEGLSLTSFDNLPEADEVIRIHFSSSDVDLLRSSIDVRITDDDLPFITASNLTFVESNNGATNAFIMVNVSAVSQAPVEVHYDIGPGNATPGIDYLVASGTLHFAANQKSKTIPVTVIGDTDFEPAETVQVNLYGASGALLRTIQAQLTISNDDGPPAVIVQVERTENGPAIHFETLPGVIYELQHRTNLALGSWSKTNLVQTNIGNTISTRMPPGFLRVLAR